MKNNLRNIVHHITYKLAILNMKELTDKEKTKHIQELNNIIDRNSIFLKENYELCKDGILDFGRLVYRCEHDKEMTEDQERLTKGEIDDIDELLKKKFNDFLENDGENIVEKVYKAVNQMRKIKYEEIKDELNIE